MPLRLLFKPRLPAFQMCLECGERLAVPFNGGVICTSAKCDPRSKNLDYLNKYFTKYPVTEERRQK